MGDGESGFSFHFSSTFVNFLQKACNHFELYSEKVLIKSMLYFPAFSCIKLFSQRRFMEMNYGILRHYSQKEASKVKNGNFELQWY